VQRRDFQVQIGQVAASLVDEHLAIEVVVQRTQLDQAQAPRHQAGGGRAARRQRDGMLVAKLGQVISGEHELRQPGAAQVIDLAGGARGDLGRRRAAAFGVEPLRERACDHFR
jgi:hypothetical protein